ncbi:DUF6204 family protein [Nonomuraea sp. NPDC059194]|uniref:DUF6204 family protein n=1 Tax=Nonomuraea sp. NPDC059194 TaxID=3346764 RepID=UPI0036BF77E6
MDTYRVIIRARFDGLTDAQRQTLGAQVDTCELGFNEKGSLAYDASLTWFTFRFQVDADDDAEAQIAALDALPYPLRNETIGVTDLTEIGERALRRRG